MIRPRLLLVDDSTDAREAFRELLGLLDFEVTGVGGAGEALALLARERFDAIVIDTRLPDRNGMDVLQVARCRPERPVAIVFSGNPATQKAAEAAGCDAFILKPRVDEVVAALTAFVLERSARMEFGTRASSQ
jgi:CheY-like chemotaxis protein